MVDIIPTAAIADWRNLFQSLDVFEQGGGQHQKGADEENLGAPLIDEAQKSAVVPVRFCLLGYIFNQRRRLITKYQYVRDARA